MPQFSLFAVRHIGEFVQCLAVAWALPAWFHWDVVLVYFIAVAMLVLGLGIVFKNAPLEANLSEKLVLCGPVLFAFPMAVFGTEHLLDPVGIGKIIPKWVPAHILLAYFVGICLVAASVSIIFRRLAGLSAALVGVMFLFFEALMHIPLAASFPHNRILWMVAVRDFCFSWGALSLAATQTTQWRVHGTHWLISAARVFIGGSIIFYGVQHFLHPELLPGVPLRQYTPAFIPGHLLWGYVTGLVYVAGGVLLLIKRREYWAATWLGGSVSCIVLIFCVPFAIAQGGTVGALNVPVDTLMFSGALLSVAGGLAGKSISPKNEADRLEPAVITSVPFRVR
jgi:uncharacterized membrane protein